MAGNRARVTVTVDPELLEEVDAFVCRHPSTDRSKVFRQALQLWSEQQRRLSMEAQFDEGEAPEEERRAWEAIRGAAAANFGRR